jgi:hypothetical protein
MILVDRGQKVRFLNFRDLGISFFIFLQMTSYLKMTISHNFMVSIFWNYGTRVFKIRNAEYAWRRDQPPSISAGYKERWARGSTLQLDRSVLLSGLSSYPPGKQL